MPFGESNENASSETAGDVGLSARVGRGGEKLRRGTEFDQVAVKQECGGVADARNLLHIVGHSDQGAILLQMEEQFLDFSSIDRIEGRSTLVQEEHLGGHGEGTGAAQARLLPAGK